MRDDTKQALLQVAEQQLKEFEDLLYRAKMQAANPANAPAPTTYLQHRIRYYRAAMRKWQRVVEDLKEL